MAELFVWDDSKYKLNVTEMDAEHKKLIDMMNKLYQKHSTNPKDAAISGQLNDFVNFALKHFADEEAYMQKIGFDGLRSHQLIHKNLVGKITEHVGNFKKTGLLTEEFFTFLKVWLASHIMGVDMKYSPKAKAA